MLGRDSGTAVGCSFNINIYEFYYKKAYVKHEKVPTAPVKNATWNPGCRAWQISIKVDKEVIVKHEKDLCFEKLLF